MAEPIVSVLALLHQAADALEDAYRDRTDVPPSVLALIGALRERSAAATVVTPDEPDAEASTVTQDEP